MPPASSNAALISTTDLARRLGDPGVKIIDASWYLPQTGRDARAEFHEGHLPGAAYFDLDENSDPASPLPHMLPPAEQFARRMSGLGLSDADLIVVYDGSGTNLSAGRAWWMFRAFGHPAVTVLDGGLGLWRHEGRSLEAGEAHPVRGHFTARLDPRQVRTLDEVRQALELGTAQVVDARARGRFEGSQPEPRPGIRGGHLPGSRNLPYTDLVAADGRLLPEPELRSRLVAEGIDPARPIIATCGSGVTACALALALDVLGSTDVAVYDGSWTEWGGRPDVPAASGPAERIR